MTTAAKTKVGAPSDRSITWDSIDWTLVQDTVDRLQRRIAKAAMNGRFGKVKALQRILTNSFSAKVLAVKRVTENKGAKTPGVDGKVWRTSKQKWQAATSMCRRIYKPQPLRRVYIPKKNGKKRPLGIPTMTCRSHQALHLLALEPVAETLANPNSYGFRPSRSCADAIEQCFKVFCRKKSARYVFEADIKACFDNISHQWLDDHIPMDHVILRKWLSCGFVEGKKLFPTTEGTPQGGIISPTLLNLTLAGLERHIKAATSASDQINVVIYADDFVVSGASREVLETKVKPAVTQFLAERGLVLSEEKTAISLIEDGFDFLGFNIRKYGEKLIIKPSKPSIKRFLRNIREAVKKHGQSKTQDLLRIVNPKIVGWANYYRHVCSKEIFSTLEHELFKIMWRWATRRHSSKPKRWIWAKYFANPSTPSGTLSAWHDQKKRTIELFRPSTIPIRRHIKVSNDRHPYQADFDKYYVELRRRRKYVEKSISTLPIF